MFRYFTRLLWHALDRVGMVDDTIDDLVVSMTVDAMTETSIIFATRLLHDDEFVDSFVEGVMEGIRENDDVPEHLHPRIEARFRKEVADHLRLKKAS